MKIKPPRTRRQLERILGFINWFRAYISHLSTKISKLYSKISGASKNVQWSEDDTRVLNEVINEIKSQNKLHYSDFDKEFELKCDASDNGMGTILTQENKVIGLFSRKLKGSELNYTTIEKETLAILESLKPFKPLIFSSKINILTDNKNLTFEGNLSKRISRWMLLLEEYNYSLKHVSASSNNDADILSRAMMVQNKDSNECANELKNIIHKLNLLKNAQISEKEKHREIFLTLKDIHVTLIHPGRNKMFEKLKNYVEIKHLKKIISKICQSCGDCHANKYYEKNNARIIFVTEPFSRGEIIAVDIKGPIKTLHFDTKAIRQETYVLAVTDFFSRFTETCFIKNIHSKTVCKSLESMWFKKHEIPQKCLTDNGKEFTSANFRKKKKKYQVKHILTAPHNPTGNAIIERINREISVALRLSRGQTLTKAIHNIHMRLNMTNNSTLKFSPYEVFFKRPITETNKTQFKIDDEKIKNSIKKTHDKWTSREIKNEIKYKVGDSVYSKVFHPDKMIKKFKGSFKIVDISKSNNCAYIDKGNSVVKVSVKNLRPFGKGMDVAAQ
ncbi:Transposon Tf2-11 polyprotein [Dictyocoela roeselum]|nr:Transposon Tf2-11 polyprotein [Dictyocoela roeselum]